MRGDRGVDDLLSDLSFRNWVLHQDDESGVYWKKWLAENPGKKETIAQARIILESLQFDEKSLSEKESEQLLKRIKNTNALGGKTKPAEAVVKPISSRAEQLQYEQSRRKSSMRTLLGYAAVLAGALIVALSIHLLSGNWKNDAGPKLVEKVNNKGQKATFFLPDGSKVVLNSSSTLMYPKEFKDDVREVYLKGEAFFDVTKGTRPFIVRTDKLAARVLGTTFNINAFPDTKEQSVSLVTGKVEVRTTVDDQQHLILEPGEKGKINSTAGSLTKTAFDYEEEVAWKEGILLFKDLPLKEALGRMERWYGVEFAKGKFPEKDYHVTGRFDNESLENVLRSIGFTIKFEYRIEKNKVHLTFQP
ncbi:FecR family protein [Cesiribacter sp. SM1]|uniref:FecR family protein n=1 Tax=Cesiribacter sp. SM1 TaxID=2861196 RepID=UPI001CD35241|nr:FecR domain-containing protein [Cesiribacter sp. SM1]